MKYVNFSNVEQLIFENTDVHHLLPPYFSNYFEQWKMGKRIPMLRQVGKRAILDFLNHIKNEHIIKLEEYFGERIIIEKLNYRNVMNLTIPIASEKICEQLCEVLGHYYYNIWRDEEHLYVCFWR
jgi:hypothetical protein